MIDRNRPYDGQTHTRQGTRGATVVAGLTMRDIGDCMRAGIDAAKAPDDRVDISEEAAVQNALCEVEKMMGIYPNVPRLESADPPLVAQPLIGRTMKLRDEAGWNRSVAANTADPYGARITQYAQDWAILMEDEIATGKKLSDVAKATSCVADTDGITGFMYGCAVSILAQVWEHGEELRRWHNLGSQIGTEGERANESGSTLNPALLNIG